MSRRLQAHGKGGRKVSEQRHEVWTDGNARCTWGTGGASESHQWGGGRTGEGHRAGRDQGSTDHAVESKCVLQAAGNP